MRRKDRHSYRRSIGADTGPPRLRLFRNDLLEQMTVISPRTFFLAWAVLLPLLTWAGWGAVRPLAWFGLVLAGLAGWSLFEYAMHRFIFHLELTSEFGRFLGFVMHGNHHADPDDPHRNMMPLVVSVTWTAIFAVTAQWLFGPAGMVFLLGFMTGYVIYDCVHYACHQLPARGPLMRALRRHHLRHHFGRTDGNYAITAIFWDRVFGSNLPVKAVIPSRGSRAGA